VPFLRSLTEVPVGVRYSGGEGSLLLLGCRGKGFVSVRYLLVLRSINPTMICVDATAVPSNAFLEIRREG